MQDWILISIIIMVSIMCLFGGIKSIFKKQPIPTIVLYISLAISSFLLGIYKLINSYLLDYKSYSKPIIVSMFITFIVAIIFGFIEKSKYGNEMQKKFFQWKIVFALSFICFILFVIITRL